MRRFIPLAVLLMILTACSSGGDDDTKPSDNPASFSGEVDIIHPLDGTVIYAESMVITGTLFGSESQTFTLQLVNPDDEIIAEAPLTASRGDWEVEIPHGYTGDPTAITIRAVPENADLGAYDSVSIFMADMSFRPDGTFATVRTPPQDAPIGGDSVLIEGSVSGLSTNQLLVALVDAEGNTLNEQTIEVFNPFFIDETLWQVEFTLTGYVGEAQIQVSDIAEDGTTTSLTHIDLTIGDSAG